jgi:hypothetical protein
MDEFSPTLHKSITSLVEELARCEPLMIKRHNQICFHLEAAQIHLFYRHVTKSQEHCKMALKAADMKVELAGMLSNVLIAWQVERKGEQFLGYWAVFIPTVGCIAINSKVILIYKL